MFLVAATKLKGGLSQGGGRFTHCKKKKKKVCKEGSLTLVFKLKNKENHTIKSARC